MLAFCSNYYAGITILSTYLLRSHKFSAPGRLGELRHKGAVRIIEYSFFLSFLCSLLLLLFSFFFSPFFSFSSFSLLSLSLSPLKLINCASCIHKEPALSRRANNKRLPARHLKLKCAWTKVLPMARRNCTWTTTLHSSTEPRLPRPITGGNVRTGKVDAPTIEEEMLPSPSYRPRCAAINTSRYDHVRRLHLISGLLPMNVKYTRRTNLDVVPMR